MKRILNYFINRPSVLSNKLILLLLFILVFTGSDLIVKQIAYLKLRNKPDVVVVPNFWSFHYVINDDIGFSALRGLNKFFSAPKKIKKEVFEQKVLNNQENSFQKSLLKRYYILDADQHYYVLSNNPSDDELEIIKNYLSYVGYRSLKWFFLVLLQGLGSFVVIAFFIYSDKWRYLIPLALIVSGALGNLLDRIIRGYVIDYVMWTFRFIPHPLFNPWPIFNLADVYTLCGAVCLFIIISFYSQELLIWGARLISNIPLLELQEQALKNKIFKVHFFKEDENEKINLEKKEIDFICIDFIKGITLLHQDQYICFTTYYWQLHDQQKIPKETIFIRKELLQEEPEMFKQIFERLKTIIINLNSQPQKYIIKYKNKLIENNNDASTYRWEILEPEVLQEILNQYLTQEGFQENLPDHSFFWKVT